MNQEQPNPSSINESVEFQASKFNKFNEETKEAPDLKAFLETNKSLALSSDDPEMPKNISEKLKEKEGEYWITAEILEILPQQETKMRIHYIDKDGNISEVDIDTQKIENYKSLERKSAHEMGRKIEEDLVRLGLKKMSLPNFVLRSYKDLENPDIAANHELRQSIDYAITNKKIRLEKEARKNNIARK